MNIHIAKRNSHCRYNECNINNQVILKGDKRVDCGEFYYGYAHPNCALKILNNRIKDYQMLKKEFVEGYGTEIVAEEL